MQSLRTQQNIYTQSIIINIFERVRRPKRGVLESITRYFYVQDGQIFPQPQPIPHRENCLDYDKQ